MRCNNMAKSATNNKQFNNVSVSAADNVEVLSYAEQVESLFLEMYEKYNVATAPDKKKANIVDSFWKDIYNIVFKPDAPQYNNCKSKIKPYDIPTIESIVNVFIKLCNRYNGVILIDSFCDLIGYSRNAVYMWNNVNKSNNYIFTIDPNIKDIDDNILYIYVNNNSVNCIKDNNNRYKDSNMSEEDKLLSRLRYDVVKKLREEEQKQSKLHLSNSDIGMIFRSNNEDELGLKYDAKRTIEQEQIKQIATAGQLPVFNKLSESDTQFIAKNE